LAKANAFLANGSVEDIAAGQNRHETLAWSVKRSRA
jgi:hypothetical protein